MVQGWQKIFKTAFLYDDCFLRAFQCSNYPVADWAQIYNRNSGIQSSGDYFLENRQLWKEVFSF